ncbi:hypothetical protein B0T19DRAFT_354377 [Cercophora scortea]|uniref:NACHT domain-containing protein n=1 Tax=Cercophora scortea TaxID=314031 RepID=A0AAE0IX87_9PEZI|nr:hypothetical protein B0T19DRAFT_354377 [Cercophora scortea]
MISVNLSQPIPLAGWAAVLCLVGAVAIWLWVHPAPAPPYRAPSSPVGPNPRSAQSTRQGVILHQVYPDKNETDTDIDIIAIHGLDTRSPDTWIWRASNPKDNVNWLVDPRMLPSEVGAARIFTCDWPADLLQPSDLVQKTIEEYALLLLDGIRREILAMNLTRREGRPIFFIASCLGGIILAKALVDASDEYVPFKEATRGIIFLATPFRGTSFRDVAALAEPGLAVWSAIQGREANKLLGSVRGSTFDLETLVRKFTLLCRDSDRPLLVFNFYEKGKTSLPLKICPWLPGWLRQEKQLVDESSATLDIVPHPLPLDRSHVLMNKFSGPSCPDYKRVARKIHDFLGEIREGTPIARADAWIREKCYNEDRLKIERLSGDMLPMDRCYINLAIVVGIEKSRRPEEGSGKDATPQTSSFSLASRLRVVTPDESIRVELSSIFDPRPDPDNNTVQPRRILIRGRAGVGKTTLCKKMVAGFPTDEFRKWNELFDRVLWVPLRRLKEWSPVQYDLEELFSHEYFAQEENRETRASLAKELRRVAESDRTLFILDGLDEISQEMSHEDYKSRFLRRLLDQHNVIITSRPHVSLPAGVRPPDLELETVGFYRDQVKEYLQATINDPKKVEEVQSYLTTHQLIEDLVRIPIQLDALCYTWDSLSDKKVVPQTMTAIYKAIEERLWKKDILRLGKKDNDGELVSKDDIEDDDMEGIEYLVAGEVHLLEGLAFTGLCHDVINFELKHRNAISKKFRLPSQQIHWDKTLPRLSFLRTSDPSSDEQSRDYHFLHLTFQEYFAARYFVRQWKANKPLEFLQLSHGECSHIEPATFLQEHKYDPRYDIFWRFVTGLLDADREALAFFRTIEKDPCDLLGPTHQRLVMHCLSEVEQKEPAPTELRELKKRLEQWLLFECDFMGSSGLAREMECPEQVLVNALKQASENARPILLESLSRRTAVPSSIINIASPWLDDCVSKRLCIAILGILRHQHAGVPDTILQGIAARLEDEDRHVRQAAIEALQGRTDLTEGMLQGIAARLEDKDWRVRQAAIEALQGRTDLTEGMLQGIAARLEDKDGYDWRVRQAAIEALQGRTDLTEGMLQGIAARLEDKDRDVRQAAIEALQGRTDLIEGMLQGIAARLEDEDWRVRQAAIEALQGRTGLIEGMLQGIAARLEDKDEDVRWAAIEALQGRTDLTEGMLQGIAARLEDKDRDVRWAAIEALQGRTDLTEGMLQGIAARLEDKDRDVRQAAIEALQGRTGLTEGMLQGIAARLEDKDGYVRQAAIRALQGRTDLTEGMLQGIAARLEDEDWRVRQAAIRALQGRTDLTEGMLQGIAARLEDEDWRVRRAAIDALLDQVALSLDVLSPYFKPLYKALLQRSFNEHLYWYDLDGGFIAVGLRNVSLSCRQHSGKEAVVKLLLEKVVGMDYGRRPPLNLAAGN